MPGLATQSEPSIKHEQGDAGDDDDDYDFQDAESDTDGNALYKPRPQLRTPAVHQRRLKDLINLLEAGTLDVEPSYQREVVWTADRMTGLIDSLMENYYIPPIILSRKEHAHPDGGRLPYTLVCVDGKQRLSSVRAFVKGMIPCHDYRGEKWWFCDGPSGKARRILPETTQKAFLEKDFVSFDFADLTSDQEEDLFARVQMGMQLTPAEKMRASAGPWQELAKLYVDDFPMIVSLLKDRTRAKDFQIILACFSQIIECHHPNSENGIPSLKTNYSTLPRFLKNRAALDEDMKSHLANVFKTFNRLIELEPDVFTNAERKLKGVQTFAPIELVSIAVLISTYSESRNDRLLLGDVRHLRSLLRENFADLRMNTTLWKFIWDYIDNLEQVRGVVEGSRVASAAGLSRPAPASTPALAIKQPTPASSLPGVKRGRPTLRTKPLKVFPGASNTVVNKPAESSADPRPHKRPRVDTPPPAAKALKQGLTGSSPFHPLPTALSPVGSRPGLATASQTMATSLLASRSTTNQQNQVFPNLSAPGQMARKSITSKPVRKNVTTTEFLETVQKARDSPDTRRSAGLVAPTQAHQNHISELGGYRAPVAQMDVTAAPQVLVAPLAVPYQTLPPLPADDYLQPHLNPAEHLQPIPTQTAFQAPQPQPKPRVWSSRSKSAGRTHSSPQYDDTIDLTSDTEQERQGLLLSFRSRETKEKGRLPGSSAQDLLVIDDSLP